MNVSADGGAGGCGGGCGAGRAGDVAELEAGVDESFVNGGHGPAWRRVTGVLIVVAADEEHLHVRPVIAPGSDEVEECGIACVFGVEEIAEDDEAGGGGGGQEGAEAIEVGLGDAEAELGIERQAAGGERGCLAEVEVGDEEGAGVGPPDGAAGEEDEGDAAVRERAATGAEERIGDGLGGVWGGLVGRRQGSDRRTVRPARRGEEGQKQSRPGWVPGAVGLR